MRWQLIAAGLLSVWLGLTGSAGAGDKGAKQPDFPTPEAVFTFAQKASAKGDWKTFVNCLAPETLDHLTAFSVMTAAVVEDVIVPSGPFPKEIKEKKAELTKVFAKYGLKTDALKKLADDKVLIEIKGPPPDQETMNKIAAAVKSADRVAFVAEVMTVIAPVIAATTPNKSFDPFLDKKLKDVKVDGEKATGKLVEVKDGVEQPNPQPIMFRQIKGNWQIIMPMGGAAKKVEPKIGEKQ
jgi:hypothetical protein